MGQRIGKNTVLLDSKPCIISNAAVVGHKEGEGPLKDGFDAIFEDGTMGQDTWEKAESQMLRTAVETAIQKAGLTAGDIQAVFSGDLLNQCIGSNFGLRELGIPFAGLYGACSTMALSLCMASLAIESGAFEKVIAATSSHFCSAEKQFRYPLEYGGQRPPSAQWTVTGSGACVLGKANGGPCIEAIHIGTIQDLGIKDGNNMGAAMAPAAKKTVSDFLSDTGTSPSDYDAIVTGDLGEIGSTLLRELLIRENSMDISSIHKDCGLMIFDCNDQDVHSGGSGCGCSASVLCSEWLNGIRDGKYKKIMFVATGALMSPVSSLQGESIPGIAHGVIIRG